MQLSVPTVKLKMQNVPTSSEILASHCIGSVEGEGGEGTGTKALVFASFSFWGIFRETAV